MRRKIVMIMVCLILFSGVSVNAASARITTNGPKTFQPMNIDRGHFTNTFQVGLVLSSVEGTEGISYLRIRITYDSSILTNYGGAFYSIPNNMAWDPPAGFSSEYITLGNASYYEGAGYITNGTHFYAINFKPNEGVEGETNIRFEVVSARDAEGNSISVGSATHTVKIGGANTNNNSSTTQDNNNSTSNTSNSNNKSTSNQPSSNSSTTTETQKSANNFLKNLIIDGYELDKEFDENIFEYTITVSSETEEIGISTELQDASAIVEITGGKGLIEGNNIVEIKVIAEDGSERIYILNIIKMGSEELEEEEQTVEIDERNNLVLIITASAVAILGTAVVIGTFMYRKNKTNLRGQSKQ